ncbi:MAG: glucuronate isomerase [Sedimentitalea sp.]
MRPQDIYEHIAGDPIVSPHGHCDPAWFADNARFADPASLLILPDHYLLRMLYSQGVAMESLLQNPDPRDVFRIFAAHWHLFLGTPSRIWLDQVLRDVLAIETDLSSDTADEIYDSVEDALASAAFTPRALFEQFNIEVLATTDAATDDLAHHSAIAASGWSGRVVPTFRPDAVLDPAHDGFAAGLDQLAAMTTANLATYDGYLQALVQRRAAFKALGATASDHAIETVHTEWLARSEIEALYARARNGTISAEDSIRFYGHMLIEMAQMSREDGLVMQLHAGSRRNTNTAIFNQFGRDMGADIPVPTRWSGLEPLLNRVGNEAGFTLILFTLDEGTYARELAPMAGHWPCLRIGPPWWFHDSAAGIARYFDQVVETAGYWNLAGFNDDTRAFLSVPARHDVWRRGVADHLSAQVSRGLFAKSDALRLARLLSTDLARDTYRLGA